MEIPFIANSDLPVNTLYFVSMTGISMLLDDGVTYRSSYFGLCRDYVTMDPDLIMDIGL